MNTRRSQDGRWHDLACDYFPAVCRRELEAYLSTIGYFWDKDSDDEVVFRSNFGFIAMSYLIETSPHYSLIITVGCGEGFGGGEVPLWYVTPKDVHEAHRSLWEFSNAEELAFSIQNIRDEIIDVCIKPLMQDSSKLRAHIDRFKEELDAKENEGMLSVAREEARLAWEKKNYEAFIFLLTPWIGKLTLTEKKEVDLCPKPARVDTVSPVKGLWVGCDSFFFMMMGF